MRGKEGERRKEDNGRWKKKGTGTKIADNQKPSTLDFFD
jgi:hypothetical protein